MRWKLLTVCLLFITVNSVVAQKVIAIKVDGTINPASASFIHDAIQEASDKKAAAVLIALNTPGGLLKSTRVIVADLLESQVPVIVYVSPGGSHAGSAGVFITMAANIAAMAPGTNIGAAHPVSPGEMDSVMNAKVTNDAAAFIRAIATERGRDTAWGMAAVTNSVSITETEALQKNIIDLVAPNERSLLEKLDGRTVKLYNGSVTLHTKKAVIERVEMNFISRLLNYISDPTVAYILMMLGFYGILFEFYNPSLMIPGIVGGFCLILAFYAMHTLPINYAGIALIVFGIILFLLEIKITSYGMLTIGGVISVLMGSLMLIKKLPTLAYLRISPFAIFGVTAFTALFFLVIIGFAVKAQKHKVLTGEQGLEGALGECLQAIDPSGTIRVAGEIWRAETLDGPIQPGETVRVTAVKGLTLIVDRVATGALQS